MQSFFPLLPSYQNVPSKTYRSPGFFNLNISRCRALSLFHLVFTLKIQMPIGYNIDPLAGYLTYLTEKFLLVLVYPLQREF